MVALHETEVDGVRCFWVETGRPTLAAQLIFRQGIADEPLVESGWLHLLEHLALHGRDSGTLQLNGTVSLLTMSFDAHGPADLVGTHLEGLTGWLAAPSFEELERERTVLRAEAELRGGPQARALAQRYGARGPGVASYFEPALGAATPDALRRRAAEALTRDNAVLALDGPPPPDLRLHLPEGRLVPASYAEPCEETPAAYVENAGLVVSGVVARSAAAALVPDLLQRALTDRLRHQDGGSYAPWASYEQVDESRAVVLAGSDVLPASRANLVGTALVLLARMARLGAQGTHLTDAIQARRQAMLDPFAAFGVALQAGHAVLNGRAPKAFDDLLTELDSTSIDEVQQALVDFHASLLLGVPEDTPWEDQLPMLQVPVGSPELVGRRFRGIGWPAVKEELIVGPTGLELRAGDQAQTVVLEQMEGVLAFEDGGRHIIRSDGYGITIEPGLWRDGTQAIQTVDATVPGELMLPQPHRASPPRPERPSTLRRWAPAVRASVDRVWTRVVGMLLLLGAVEVGLVYVLSIYIGDPTAEDRSNAPIGLFVVAAVAVPLFMVAVVAAGFQAWREERSDA